jgi:OmpA-OmpF porin, OOP family
MGREVPIPPAPRADPRRSVDLAFLRSLPTYIGGVIATSEEEKKMKYRVLILCAIACLVAPAAFAGTGFVGASAGRTSVSADLDTPGGSENLNANDTGWKAFGGYDFIRYFGVEGGYADMGTFGDEGSNADVNGLGVYARGLIPIGEKVELFGKLGMVRWDLETDGGSETGNDLAFGAGAAFMFAQKFSVRLEYERFDTSTDIMDNSNVDMGSVGFAYRF